jgi:hypothetical protein
MHSTAGDATNYVGGDHAHGVGGDQVNVVAGKRTTSVGDNDKHSVDGDWNVSATGSLDISARTRATLETKGQAKINGASIVLGSNGSHPLPKFDVFLVDLTNVLGLLVSAIGNLVPSNPFALAAVMIQLSIATAKIGIQLPYLSTKVRND